MTKNVGSTDKIIRYVIAAVMIGLYFSGKLPGNLAYAGLAVGVIALVTSLINFCPLYAIIGVKTNKS